VKPNKWHYGEVAPYVDADVCPAHAGKKKAGVKMGKTGSRTKTPARGATAAAASAAASGAPVRLEILEARQLLGQRLVDPVPLAEIAAADGGSAGRELVPDEQMASERLVLGRFRPAGKVSDPGFFGVRWVDAGQLQARMGEQLFLQAVGAYANLLTTQAGAAAAAAAPAAAPAEEEVDAEGAEQAAGAASAAAAEAAAAKAAEAAPTPPSCRRRRRRRHRCR